MCGAQGELGWCQPVHVPVHSDAVNVARSMNVAQDLKKDRILGQSLSANDQLTPEFSECSEVFLY